MDRAVSYQVTSRAHDDTESTLVAAAALLEVDGPERVPSPDFDLDLVLDGDQVEMAMSVEVSADDSSGHVASPTRPTGIGGPNSRLTTATVPQAHARSPPDYPAAGSSDTSGSPRLRLRDRNPLPSDELESNGEESSEEEFGRRRHSYPARRPSRPGVRAASPGREDSEARHSSFDSEGGCLRRAGPLGGSLTSNQMSPKSVNFVTPARAPPDPGMRLPEAEAGAGAAGEERPDDSTRSPPLLPARTSSFFVKTFTIHATKRNQALKAALEQHVQEFDNGKDLEEGASPLERSRLAFLKKRPEVSPLVPPNPDPPHSFEGMGIDVDRTTLQLLHVDEGGEGMPQGLSGCVGKYLTHIGELRVETYEQVEDAYAEWKKSNSHQMNVRFSKYTRSATGASIGPNVSLPHQVVVMGESQNDLRSISSGGTDRKANSDGGDMHRADSFLGVSSVTSNTRFAAPALKSLVTDVASILAFTAVLAITLSTPLIIWIQVGSWAEVMELRAPAGDNATVPQWEQWGYIDVDYMLATAPHLLGAPATSGTTVARVNDDVRTAWAIVEWTSVGILQFSVFFCMITTRAWRWVLTIQAIAIASSFFYLLQRRVSGDVQLQIYTPVLIIYFSTGVLDALYLKAVGKKRSYLIIFSFLIPAFYLYLSLVCVLQVFDDADTSRVMRCFLLLLLYPAMSSLLSTITCTVSRHGMVADDGFLSVSFSIAVLCITSSVSRLMLTRSEKWLQIVAACTLAFYHFVERTFYLRKSVAADCFIIRKVYPHVGALRDNLKDESEGGGNVLHHPSAASIASAKDLNIGGSQACTTSLFDESELWIEGNWFHESVLAEYFCALCLEIVSVVSIAVMQLVCWGQAHLFFDLHTPEGTERNYWFFIIFVIQIVAEVVASTVALFYQSCPGSAVRLSLLEFIVRAMRKPRLLLLLSASIFFVLTLTLSLSKIELKIDTHCTQVAPASTYVGHLSCLNGTPSEEVPWVTSFADGGSSVGGSASFPFENSTYCCRWPSYLSDTHLYFL